jgi:arabinan endo-1,5-alpha-L-arabinosidase
MKNDMRQEFKNICAVVLMALLILASACSSDDAPVVKPPVDDTTGTITQDTFNIDLLSDTYPTLAPIANYKKWGPYNVHDPSILKVGDYFYCYSTDAAYGTEVQPGIQIRKSKDLVEWEFVGWALSSATPIGSNFIKNNGGTPFNSYWAPYIMKVGTEFRLYYSLSSAKPRLSVIGLLTSASPEGPWTEKGLAVTSLSDNSIQTNAIDPTVLIDKSGDHWMYYGSAWDGIYILKLDKDTGLAATSGDKGIRIAQRGFTGNTINGNIEGAEIIYNPQLDKYFLFIAYDWLETKYNVRVARGDSPQGPFYDFNGVDVNTVEDHGPMIIAPYKFKGHGGWQGTSHVTVFNDGDQFYIAHQGRPGIDRFYMVLHVRKLFWNSDGWPVASPERYAATQQTTVALDEIDGTWERIVLNYAVVPGFSAEQTSPDFQNAADMVLNADGTIGTGAGTWTYESPLLTLTWNSGSVEKVWVERGRDWENKKANALIFTGLDEQGTAVWGKK